MHQLSLSITSSNAPTPTPSSVYTPSLAQSSISNQSSSSTNRADRTFKKKIPNHPFPSKPGTARLYINHPNINLPSFPNIHVPIPTITTDNQNYVDEHVLIPTLHWTSFYDFSNPLRLSPINTPQEIVKYENDLHRLTTALSPRQFTHVGYKKKTKKMFTAPRDKDYSIEHYDHNIIRPNQDQLLDDDKFANPQLTEKFFIRTPYIFTLSSLDKNMITSSQKHYYYAKFDNFSLTFHFFTPKERDLHCSHDIMLRAKQTHIYTCYRFKQNHYDLHTPSRQPRHSYQFLNSKYTSPFFLNFT